MGNDVIVGDVIVGGESLQVMTVGGESLWVVLAVIKDAHMCSTHE